MLLYVFWNSSSYGAFFVGKKTEEMADGCQAMDAKKRSEALEDQRKKKQQVPPFRGRLRRFSCILIGCRKRRIKKRRHQKKKKTTCQVLFLYNDPNLPVVSDQFCGLKKSPLCRRRWPDRWPMPPKRRRSRRPLAIRDVSGQRSEIGSKDFVKKGAIEQE